MMVRASSKFQEFEDMSGTTICLTSGTTTELNLASVFGARNIKHTPLIFKDNPTPQPAFVQAVEWGGLVLSSQFLSQIL